MRINFILSIVLLCVLYSCSDKDKLPKDVMSRQKMTAVLWDMLRAGEFLENYVFNKDTAVDKVIESEKWYDKVYEVHGITKEQFKASFAYYKDNLKALQPILDSLSKRQAEENYPENSISSGSPVDSNLLKRKDSLLKIRREERLRRETPSPSN